MSGPLPSRAAFPPHGREQHRSGRSAWLRAAVLGANDGLISTAALVVGVAGADNQRSAVLVAGIAGLTAGALSMAAGEYVSVSSQRDTELADLERERTELAASPEAERDELAAIYRNRGLSAELADRVADELSARDDIEAIHARDELGVDLQELANPVQASTVSAVSFALGAVIPIITAGVAPTAVRVLTVMAVTLIGLMGLGILSARLGGAPPVRAVVRVLVGGLVALVISLLIGRVTGSVV